MAEATMTLAGYEIAGETFVSLATLERRVAAEREACIRLAYEWKDEAPRASDSIARAIRARGNT